LAPVRGAATPKLSPIPLASWERGGVIAVLKRAGLPADDVEQPGPLFWRFETADTVPVGFGGLEIHRPHALLRSIVTLPPLRGRHYGHAIVDELEAEARIAGCHTAWLLTTSTADFFAELGYVRREREDVPEAIRSTRQYAVLCPASATVMMKPL
jgi:N-acetylglutamate synthase-like GNAT family acetyltransferase